MSDPIKVTIVSGAVADATNRVFERILQNSPQQKITGIAPKRGRKKSRSIAGASVITTTERLMRLGQGCSCCTVRSDLMTKVQRIAKDETADHVVIQATPQSDLRTLAKTFTVADESGAVLSDLARIEGFVAVIDAGKFLERLGTSAARTHIEHIEIANLIVIEGASDLPNDAYDRLLLVISALNSAARIERADEDDFSIDTLHVAEAFDLDAVEQRSTDWNDAAESREIVRFQFHARRPFHPGRLHALMSEAWSGVLRAQGTFWVASQPGFVRTLDVAGGSRRSSCAGMWWATVPETERPNDRGFKEHIDAIWHPEFGDRHQDLDFMGIELNEVELRAQIEKCLLTEEEMAAAERWHSLPDPFDWPAMDV